MFTNQFKITCKNQIADILLAQQTVEENLRLIAKLAANVYVQSENRKLLTLANTAEQQREFLRLQCIPWYEFRSAQIDEENE